MNRSEYKYQQWLENHRINDDNVIERFCNKCKQWKIEDADNYFLKNKTKPELGYLPECIICCRIRAKNYYYNNIPQEKERSQKIEVKAMRNKIAKEWRKENSDKWSEYFRKYLKLERVKEKYKIYNINHRIHDISKKEWEACLFIFDYKCAYCNCSLEEAKEKYKQNLHKEHVNPEGANDLSNCVPACRICNECKWIFVLDDWYNENNPKYSKSNYNKIIWWITEGYKNYIENKLPYKIVRKKDKETNTFYWELWSVDDKRNLIKCIDTNKKKELLNIHLIEI